jgi:hypothetical protein
LPQDIKETLADETDKLVHKISEHGIDGIIGGFPCQDISVNGKKSGIGRNAAGDATTRSGLFWEMVRTVCMVRPKYWLMENVAELLNGHLGIVLEAVAGCGYDAEWDCISASSIGAPHHRGRNTYLPTPLAQEGAGCSRKRYKGSPSFRGTRTAEGLRTSYDCPAYLNPSLAEVLMGLPKDYTRLETEIPLVLSEKSQED